MSGSPVVRLDGVSKSFPTEQGDTVRVLDRVELVIQPGEKASLIGPSGSGKSTLLSLIAGLLRPDSGTIEVDGVPMGLLDEAERARLRARRIGIALQFDNLIPFLSAQENVELSLSFGKAFRGTRATKRRALELLEQLGVGHRARHRPRQLSGGEVQRVALAVAIANQPALLLADEVVAQLDGETAGHVITEVLEAEFAVLYVTHQAALADRAERRYRLHEGRVEAR